MPRMEPLYHPIVTMEQLGEAEKITRQRKARHAQFQRARLVLLLYEEPDLDNAGLAKRLGQHPNWVRKWRKRWVTEGFSLEEKKGRGRKPHFSPSGKKHSQSDCL